MRVCTSAIDWQCCWLNPTWRPVSWQHWCHKSGQGLECMSDWEPERDRQKKGVCAFLSVLCVLSVYMCVCVCVCGLVWVSASQPAGQPARVLCMPKEPLYQLGEPGARLPPHTLWPSHYCSPPRPAQSTATCYQINIISHQGQHVIPPLRGQTTHVVRRHQAQTVGRQSCISFSSLHVRLLHVY